MKITWLRENDNSYCEVVAELGEYDAYLPASALLIDHIPRLVSKDRLTAAFTLAFMRYSSGQIDYGHGVSPEMAESIEQIFLPSRVRIGNVDFVPKNYTTGSNIFSININGKYSISRDWHDFSDPRVIELNLTEMCDDFSSSFHSDVLRVPTNAHILARSSNGCDLSIGPFLAVALLLSEDFDIGGFRVPASLISSAEVGSIRDLLRTCGITIELLAD